MSATRTSFVDLPNYRVQRTEDQLPLFVHKPANFAPGDGCRYCNGGYVLLGLMIARAAGVPYRSYVTDHVLGAEATAAALEPLVRYKAEGEIVRMNGLVFEFDVGPDGGFRSYAKDGINVGVSGILRHYPGEDVTVAVLAVGERAAWEPIALLDRVLAP